jgi:hypothetical protein
MINCINLDSLRRRVQEDAKSFREADPFPHLVFDDLLVEEIKNSSEHFSCRRMGWMVSVRRYDAVQETCLRPD